MTETATSRTALRRVALIAATVAVAALVAGCGESASKVQRSTSRPEVATASAPVATSSSSSFSWLRATGAPAGWHSAGIPAGGTLAYPPGWRLTRGDAGTATAVLLTRSGRYLGYLNITPRQGPETLSTWPRFRVEHNGEEGDRGVRMLAATTGRRLGAQRVSCVTDSYTTTTHSPYNELACLLEGARSAVVVVGASPPQSWAAVAPLLERAITSARA